MLTVGRSSHFRGSLAECLKFSGPAPRNDDKISPLAFCIVLSDWGVRPGPPTAATFGLSKYFRQFFSQSLSGYASPSMNATTSPFATDTPAFRFSEGLTGPVGKT